MREPSTENQRGFAREAKKEAHFLLLRQKHNCESTLVVGVLDGPQCGA